MPTDIRFETDLITLIGPTKLDGAVTVQKKLAAKDAAELASTLSVGGAATLASSLSVAGTATCAADVVCKKDLFVDGTLVKASSPKLIAALETALASNTKTIAYAPEPVIVPDVGVTPGGGGTKKLPTCTVTQMSVGEVLMELAEEIIALRKRVAALEA